MSTAPTACDYQVELIDGQEIQKPLPKTLHGIVQARLIVELSRWTGQLNLIVSSEQDVLCGPDRLIPDVTVASANGPFENGSMKSENLDLAVEIMSPGQTFLDMLGKCERLVLTGTRMCWIIWPKRRKAWVYQHGQAPLEVTQQFIFRDQIISLSTLFDGLDQLEAKGAI